MVDVAAILPAPAVLFTPPLSSTSMGLYDCALLCCTFVRFPRDFLVYANYAKNVGVSARLHKVGEAALVQITHLPIFLFLLLLQIRCVFCSTSKEHSVALLVPSFCVLLRHCKSQPPGQRFSFISILPPLNLDHYVPVRELWAVHVGP